MAVLRRIRDRRCISVGAHALVGRYPTCDIVLPNPRVSGNHALFLHDDDGWSVKPHLTTNGTSIDDVVAPPGVRHRIIRTGTRMWMGTTEEEWEWVDLGPPGPAAVDSSGSILVADEATLALPDEHHPQLLVAATGSVWSIHGDERNPVVDGELLQFADETFRLLLPAMLRGGSQQTAPSDSLPDLKLELTISPDGDEIRHSAVVVGGARRTLRVRRHTHLLLELGEARMSDAVAGLPEPEQGWLDVELLCRRLGLSPSLLHLWTFRARAQLAMAGIPHPMEVIEDRGERARRQLRLGIGEVLVLPTP